MKSFQRLTSALKRLPGVGPKQAERLAMFLLRSPDFEVESLVAAMREAKTQVHFCAECYDFTDRPTCRICADPARDRSLICVVEEPQDVSAIERTRGYQGLYHVLHGALSPLDGVGPDLLKIKELVDRVAKAQPAIAEIIVATDPDTEGEATALYLSQRLKGFASLKTTRIAHGVPLGGDLDYIDERTLSHAMSGRRQFSA